MSTSLDAEPRPPITRTQKPAGKAWFAGFWRWHFYASFLVIPVLTVLAVTGLIYLFRFQIEPVLNADLMTTTPPAAGAEMQNYARQLAVLKTGLENSLPAGGDQAPVLKEAFSVVSMTEPSSASATTRFSVAFADGSGRDYFVDPYRAVLLGSVDPDRTLSGIAVLLHRELMAGMPGEFLMELGACWAIVMALTGYVLFFKGWKARRRALRRAWADAALMKGSNLVDARLRQWHALGGAVVGILLLGLLVSGLPWTAVWGKQTQKIATAQGTSFWSDDHGALSDPTSTLDESLPHSHRQEVPWGLGQDKRPQSGPNGADPNGAEESVANLDTAVQVAEVEGLARPYTIVLPEDETGVFSVIAYAFNDPGQERSLHIDQYGGTVVSTYGWDDYSALAKTVAQGIALHEGRRLGLVNMIGSTLMCLTVLFLCVTGPVMWWRRRPKGSGSIGAPRAKLPLKATPWLAAGLIALSLFLPLFGLSVLILLLLDQLLLRRIPRLATWFDIKT